MEQQAARKLANLTRRLLSILSTPKKHAAAAIRSIFRLVGPRYAADLETLSGNV
jgi:hypothetical protein